MESHNHRYTETATTKYSYRNEYQVECPKCGSLASIKFPSPYFYSGGQLSCSNCNHFMRASELIRYNAVINRYCDNRGKYLEKTLSSSKAKVDKITIPCPHCGITRTFHPKHEKVLMNYNSRGDICDPVFNLPLWFQINVKGKLLWAYNRKHLNDIRMYVFAKLRERTTPHFTTMVEMLPNFIKIAKNREDILKAINRLMKK